MEKLALSPAEAAEVIGVSMPTMYDLCHRADFPSFRLGRKILIPVDPLREWANRRALEVS